jgi:hypothetical protein
MDPRTTWMLIAAIVVVAIAAAGWYVWRTRRSERLRKRFGPEYERTVREAGNVARAEASLAAREVRVAKLHLKPLTAEDRTRYGRGWRTVQTRFVDDPEGAVTEADRLVGDVMHARGYPVGDFEQRVADISVDHPNVVMHYRAARDIAQEHARGRASTEDLRQAMVHYRALFSDLLEAPVEQPEPAPAPEPPVARRTR